MPSGRPRGPRRVDVPEGYLTVRDAAARLGLSVNGVRKLLYAGVLPSIAGPSQAKGFMRFIPLSAVETYQPPRRGRPPGTPDAKPRQAIHRVAPPRSRHPRQTVTTASNGQGPPELSPRQGQAPAKVWASLERLEEYRRDVWFELRAGGREAVQDEWYLLLRRLLFAELALLEELFEEPDAKSKDEKVDWFADEEDDDG